MGGGAADLELALREELFADANHFRYTPEAWQHLFSVGREGTDLIRVGDSGRLAAYAVCRTRRVKGSIDQYLVLDYCAREGVAGELLRRIEERARKRGAHEILCKLYGTGHADAFERRGFVGTEYGTFMTALLADPRALLETLSKRGVGGRTLCLAIDGYPEVFLRWSGEDFSVVARARPDAVLSMDDRAFLRLLFGKERFLPDLVRGRIRLRGKKHILALNRLFRAVKRDEWLITMGEEL